MEVIDKVIENNFKNGNKKTQIVLTHTSRNLFDFMTAIKLRFGGKPIKLPHYLIGKDGKILQILDDGHVTDSLGRKINFKNTMIIMTSNIGVKKLQDFGTGVGFKSSNSDAIQEEHRRDVLKKELSKFFAPEFLNRIDDVVIFNSLRKEHIDVITKLEIDKLLERVTSKNYFFSYDQNVIDLISEVGFDETFGARPIKRAIQDKIEDLISEKILTDEIVENQEYVLVVEGEKENRKISVLTKEIPKTTKKRTSKIK